MQDLKSPIYGRSLLYEYLYVTENTNRKYKWIHHYIAFKTSCFKWHVRKHNYNKKTNGSPFLLYMHEHLYSVFMLLLFICLCIHNILIFNNLPVSTV